ncbi:MAG: 16S rRNA (guanine(966)-N(2))-methyltransferase RsmD [Burkholderiales bacterium]|nr:16S rRNA (guanine(966)-N(2))-methyltransferase RsmD [Burkholderiales bacterium]
MNTKTKKAAPVKRATHQVRIIGGQWKRTPLNVIDAEGLRPTPDRVRETAFNWLNHLFDGNWAGVSCLDLFAGSGALGFEAASRGARQVSMVEAHTPALRQLEQVKQKLNASQVSLLRGDALKCAASLAAQGQRFTLIFLDPPFKLDWLAKILPLCGGLLDEHGLLYVEAEHLLTDSRVEGSAPAWMAGWRVIRADQAGSVFFHILQRSILLPDTHENQA